MDYVLGIDIGSTTSKGVILRDQEIFATAIVKAGTGTDGPEQVRTALLEQAGLSEGQIRYIMATGYGRKTYPGADGQMSELSCHARGTVHLFPGVRTVIDIGGQDAKVLSLNAQGKLENFIMNDKCAAGTGRFLDVMAQILQMDISELEGEAFKSEHPVTISSTCTVFAESEVISQLAAGVNRPDLVAGICRSVASRVSSLAKRIGVVNQVCMSGGVAQNGGVRKAMEEELGEEIFYSDMAQLTGALGAALYAADRIE